MSFLDDILEKLGLPRTPVEEDDRGGTDTPMDRDQPGDARRKGKGARRNRPDRISKADVVKKLDELSGGNDNWKVSIVELLNLLGIDSSLEARKEMATELGIPPAKMDDTAKMNTWLHKKVLRKIANHGGNIPPKLLD
jgi:hypothetical protein